MAPYERLRRSEMARGRHSFVSMLPCSIGNGQDLATASSHGRGLPKSQHVKIRNLREAGYPPYPTPPALPKAKPCNLPREIITGAQQGGELLPKFTRGGRMRKIGRLLLLLGKRTEANPSLQSGRRSSTALGGDTSCLVLPLRLLRLGASVGF